MPGDQTASDVSRGFAAVRAAEALLRTLGGSTISVRVPLGVAAVGDAAEDVWSDTRSIDLFICPGTAAPGVPPALCTGSATNAARANDQDIFSARTNVPGGGGR